MTDSTGKYRYHIEGLNSLLALASGMEDEFGYNEEQFVITVLIACITADRSLTRALVNDLEAMGHGSPQSKLWEWQLNNESTLYTLNRLFKKVVDPYLTQLDYIDSFSTEYQLSILTEDSVYLDVTYDLVYH